jgi:Zn-dependent peptidase ImmA (M78 family)
VNEILEMASVRAIIDRYTQDAPVNVEAMARDLGLVVRLDETMDRDTAGKIVKEATGSPAGYAVYINASDIPPRRRFTLAHELGHYVLHRDLVGDGLIDSAMYRSKLGDIYERQANRFAADILMPAALVRGLYRGGTTALAPLATMLGVSEAAVRIRLQELRLAP